MASASPETLVRVAEHLAEGTVKVPIQQTYDIARALQALHALAAAHTQGRLALHIA